MLIKMSTPAAKACKRWREQYPERQKESCRKWREKNPGRGAILTSKWREANPGKNAKACKNWQLNNPEKALKARQNWQRNNYAKLLAYNAIRRARRVGVEEHFTSKQAVKVVNQFDNQCFKCGSAEYLQIDHHLPLVLGHSLTFGNAVVLCRRCNAGKRAKLPVQFYTESELSRLILLLQEQEFWDVWTGI